MSYVAQRGFYGDTGRCPGLDAVCEVPVRVNTLKTEKFCSKKELPRFPG